MGGRLYTAPSCQLLPFQLKSDPSLPKTPNLEARLKLKFFSCLPWALKGARAAFPEVEKPARLRALCGRPRATRAGPRLAGSPVRGLSVQSPSCASPSESLGLQRQHGPHPSHSTQAMIHRAPRTCQGPAARLRPQASLTTPRGCKNPVWVLSPESRELAQYVPSTGTTPASSGPAK